MQTCFRPALCRSQGEPGIVVPPAVEGVRAGGGFGNCHRS